MRPRARQQVRPRVKIRVVIFYDDDDDVPASCGSGPVSDDVVPVPDEEPSALGDVIPPLREETPAPVDSAPALVFDDLPSCRRLLACCCVTSRLCTRWRSTSAKMPFSDVLPWICARCSSLSATVAS